MKIFRVILLAGIASGCNLTLQCQTVNGIKAVVHDSVISFYEVEVLTAPIADVLRNQFRSQPETYQKKVSEALGENLDQLIERQLILHDFETSGYNRLPESVIDELVQDRIRDRFGDRASLIKSLQAQGITYEKFRQQLRDQFIVEAMRSKNIASEVMISPHKIEAYYAEHQTDYQLEDQVKLRMIVLNNPTGGDTNQVHELAEEILSKIKAGAAFPEMASVYSQGSQRNQGGDWGWVERSVLRKELAEVAFTLKPGETSGIIETPEALYLMRVEDIKPTHVKPLTEVRDDIEKILLARERTRLAKQYVARLKKKTFVRYF